MRGFWTLVGATTLVTVLAVAVVSWQVAGLMQEQADRQTGQELAVGTAWLANAVRAPLASGDVDSLRAEVDALSEADPSGWRLTVVAADGTVLADTDEDPARMDDHGARPEIVQARAGGERRPVLRTSRTLGTAMLYLAEAVRDGEGRLLGFARLSIPDADLLARSDRLRAAVLRGALPALLVGAALSYVLARSVRRPIADLADFVQRVAHGERPPSLPVHGNSDLDGLARAANQMADELSARLERIDRDDAQRRAILGSMQEGVLAVDRDHRVVLLNASAARLLELGSDDIVGRSLPDIARLAMLDSMVAATLDGGRPDFQEFVRSEATGDRVLRTTAAPLAEGDETWGCLLVLHDLTEMRRLETVRRDFVANVSHELKTPLTALRGYLETILDDPEMDGETRLRFLQRSRSNVDRMVAIVSDLLALARLESDVPFGARQTIDLRQLALECRDAGQEAAAARSVLIELELPESPLRVEGDRAALATAVLNLLDNAVKYGPENGRVLLAVRAVDGDGVISVKDDGPGIPAHERERIFERFYRLDKDRSRALGGTGLGLAIVRNVATSHGGQVTLQCRPGHGSEFGLRLPLAAGAVARRDQPS